MIVQPIPPFRNQSMSTFGIATKKIAYQTKLQCSQIAPICPKIGGRTEIPTSLFQSSKTKMSIYPNPVVDKLMINTDESNKLFSVRLLNLFGQIVWKGALNGNTQIDMKYLPKGMYTLQINSAEGNTFNRIIKQ